MPSDKPQDSDYIRHPRELPLLFRAIPRVLAKLPDALVEENHGGLRFDRLTDFQEEPDDEPAGQRIRLLPATAENLERVEDGLWKRLAAWRQSRSTE